MKKNYRPYILSFMLFIGMIVVAAHPLFDSRPLDGHDPGFNMIRLKELSTLMRHGTAIPRWAPDLVHGYGYPFFIFYPALSYLCALPAYETGFGLASSIKLVYLFGFIVGAWFMYRLGIAFGSRRAAWVGAMLYTFAPYRLVNIYVRASYAEFFAMALIPCIFWAVMRYAQSDKRRYCAFFLAALVALNLSHSISAMIWYPITLVFALIAGRVYRKNSYRSFVIIILCVFLCACGITGFFWVPALAERAYVQISRMTGGAFSYTRHFVYPAQLFARSWGYGTSVPGTDDTMPFQIGWPHLVALCAAAAALCRASKPVGAIIAVSLSCTAVALFMMIPLSSWVWSSIPLLHYLQFPWRLLMVTSVFSSIAGLLAVVVFDSIVSHRFVWITIIAAIVAYSYPYCKAQYIDDPVLEQSIEEATEYLPMPYGSSTLLLEYLPRWVRQIPDQPAGRKIEPPQSVAVHSIELTPTEYRFEADVSSPGFIRVHTFFYPGWRCYIDGTRVPIRPVDPTGDMHINLPDTGSHSVIIRFENTPLRRNTLLWSIGFVFVAVTGLYVLPRSVS